MKQDAVKRAKITDKGQVTIPRQIRDLLGSRHVEFVVEKEQVILRPVPTARGSLSDYADAPLRGHEEGASPRAVAESQPEPDQRDSDR